MKKLFNPKDYFKDYNLEQDKKQAENVQPNSTDNPYKDNSKEAEKSFYQSIAKSEEELVFSPSYYHSLEIVRQTLEEHKPYAVCALSTTGINRGDFRKHTPIKIYIQIYDYNRETNTYTEGNKYERLIQCSEEALNEAIRIKNLPLEDKRRFDVFANGGIDLESYRKGINVASPELVKKELDKFFQDNSNIERIVFNGKEFVSDSLSKINISIENLLEQHSIHASCQVKVTEEYFLCNGYHSPRNTLQHLTDYLTREKGKQELIDVIKNNCVGTDERVRIIGSFIDTFGEENGLIKAKTADEIYADIKKSEKAVPSAEHISTMSEPVPVPDEVKTAEVATPTPIIPENNESAETKQGEVESDKGKADQAAQQAEETKPAIEKQGAYKAIERLIQFNGLNPEEIDNPNSDSAYNKLVRIFANQNDIEGFTIIQAYTTSDQTGNQPIEICMGAFKTDNGTAKTTEIIDFMVETSTNTIEKELAKTPKSFIDKGLTQLNYNTKALSQNEALEKLSDFFEKYPISKYPIVSDKSSKEDPTISCTQHSLSKLGNLSEFQAPFIDKDMVIKEYTYLSEKYGKNVLIPIPEKYNGDLSVTSIASGQKVQGLNSLRTQTIFSTFTFIKMITHEKEINPQKFEAPFIGLEEPYEPQAEESKPSNEPNKVSNNPIQEDTTPKDVSPQTGNPNKDEAPPEQSQLYILKPEVVSEDKKAPSEDKKAEEPPIEASEPIISPESDMKPDGYDSGIGDDVLVPVSNIIKTSKEPDVKEEPTKDTHSETPLIHVQLPLDSSKPVANPSQDNLSKALEAIKLLIEGNIGLTKIIEKNQSAITELISHQSKMIEEIMQEQNEEKLVPAFSNEADINQHTVDYLQKIKDEISIVSHTIGNEQVSEELRQANQKIEKGQNILYELSMGEKEKIKS